MSPVKVLLEIRDDKAAFFMELLQSFKFVKTKPLSPYKAEVLEGLLNAVEEMNEIKAGKKKAQPLNEFLNEI